MANTPRKGIRDSAYRAGKRVLDIAGALAGLMILFVLFPFMVALIKFDSRGPIFFVQTRMGQYGHRFKFVKFRTMRVGAHQQQWELDNLNESGGLTFKISNDPRVTRMGRFLRRTSLDEMPQFWNVLRGDMSLVGPRPPLLREVSQYNDIQKVRMTVPQGMTGLWQVRGRSKLKFNDMVDLDVYYALHPSLAIDLKILMATIPTVLFGRGAV
ncbi:MAG: sugar transferase [Fibrobacteres bacterium]|jgi:lipopolysaccharide/colanic/teichoic acid biosynthesis glycosyltransferase|nr:sugar transferase [Fibrobacterota bacterium]